MTDDWMMTLIERERLSEREREREREKVIEIIYVAFNALKY